MVQTHNKDREMDDREQAAVEKQSHLTQSRRNQEHHDTPKGLRPKPHPENPVTASKAGDDQASKALEEKNRSREAGAHTGVHQGTVEAGPEYSEVVEGQLGGGEKVVYSEKDGGPLDPQDHIPRSS